MRREVLHIGNKNEAYYLKPTDILFVEADGNYCNIYRTDGDKLEAVLVQLGEMARKIDALNGIHSGLFAQVGRKYIVNTDHILRIAPSKQILTLDLNNPENGKKFVLHPSVKALQQFRIGLDARMAVSMHPTSAPQTTRIQGFASFVESNAGKADKFDVSDDEVLFLGK